MEKGNAMRVRDSLVMLVLAVISVAGMAFSDHFPQATYAESVGFDALAHTVFSMVPGTAPGTAPGQVVAK
jgi:hypothetical protein